MASAVPPPDAVAILDLVRVRVDALARDSSDDPLLEGMPDDIARHELPLTARRYYAAALRLMRSGGQFDRSDLELARHRAAQRAEEGMPLPLVLHNWQHAARLLWQACVDAAGDRHIAGLGYLGHQLYAFQDAALQAVTESYQARLSVLRDEDLGTGRMLAQALLAGQEPGPETGHATSAPLASRYAILTLTLPPLPSSPARPVTHEVTTRRRVRQVATALAHHHAGRTNLAVLEATHAQILLPADTHEPDPVVAERANALHRALRTETRLDIRASCTDPAEIRHLPASARVGHDLLRLARSSTAAGDHTHRIADHALDYHLTHVSPAQATLLGQIEPLHPHPELVDTLRAWFTNDLDRARTARALGVHPNTVNNRLHRVGRLLDADVTSFTTQMTLATALTIHGHRADHG
ncbi:PucR family transcriptional regulator [Streptomyces sp. cg35]|uniref:PucR family transcriptional regulator n=1 Tax=Streptomyces sp. cg35 TaxID=3421650 RepID=UPI003D167925